MKRLFFERKHLGTTGTCKSNWEISTAIYWAKGKNKKCKGSKYQTRGIILGKKLFSDKDQILEIRCLNLHRFTSIEWCWQEKDKEVFSGKMEERKIGNWKDLKSKQLESNIGKQNR